MQALSSDAAESAVDMDKAAEHIIALGNTINTAAAAAATQKQAHRTAIRALEADLEPFLTAKEVCSDKVDTHPTDTSRQLLVDNHLVLGL